MRTYEWWGEPGVAYDDAWKAGFDGVDTTLADLVSSGPYDGVLGFSQGGGLASVIPARWFVGFSAVEPPPGRAGARGTDARPNLHLFDAAEEYVAQCHAVQAQFASAEEQTHTAGHTVPNDAAAVARFGAFLDARLAELRPVGEEPDASATAPPTQSVPLAPPAPAAPAPVAGTEAQGETADAARSASASASALKATLKASAATNADADADADAAPPLETIDYAELVAMGPETVARVRRAFVGEAAYGIVGVRGVPRYEAARREAFTAAVELAVHDDAGRERAAAVRQTYPGWNGTPGRETHPLQSCWIHNIKEEVGAKQVDPFYGKNVWPDDALKHKFTAMNECMCDAT